jgi:hypothetical protein
MKREKNNLRNILNEEYGWFRQDTLSKKTQEPAPRFRIEWSEIADSTAATNTKPVEEPDNLLKRLVRRKKNNNP